MPPSKTSIIVFDIDGTLTDTIAPHQSAFEAALRSFGFPALRTDWASYRHHSDSAILIEAWEEAGFPGRPDMIEFETRYRAAFQDAISNLPVREIQGSSHFLSALKRSEWAVCFATGSLRYGAMRKLEALSCPIDHDLLVTASEFQTREEIVSEAMERARRKYAISEVRRVVSVGDGLWDLLTAQNLGLEFLAIANGEKAKAFHSRGVRVMPDLAQGMDVLGA